MPRSAESGTYTVVITAAERPYQIKSLHMGGASGIDSPDRQRFAVDPRQRQPRSQHIRCRRGWHRQRLRQLHAGCRFDRHGRGRIQHRRWLSSTAAAWSTSTAGACSRAPSQATVTTRYPWTGRSRSAAASRAPTRRRRLQLLRRRRGYAFARRRRQHAERDGGKLQRPQRDRHRLAAVFGSITTRLQWLDTDHRFSATNAVFTIADINPGAFALADDGSGGTELTVCYARGTMVQDDDGEVPVENLKPGDAVMTLAAECVPLPVIWIGHQTCRPD